MNKRGIAVILAALGLTMIPQNKCDASVYNGWELSNGNWYYYTNGNMRTGWVKDKDTWYYLKTNGSMAKGWIKDAGNWYYLGSDGSMQTGWIKDRDKWYYLNSNGSMVTGWIKDRGSWYYLNSDGTMRTGVLVLVKEGKEYYFGKDGAMKTGWFKRFDEDKGTEDWYYAESDGNIKKGWLYYNNLWYYLTEDGALASNDIIRGYYINKDGVWDKSCDNKVMLAINKESYDINERYYVVKLLNNTNNEVNFSKDLSIERYENGQWVKIDDNRTSSESEMKLSPKTSGVLIESFVEFRDQIKPGKYRLGSKVNGEYYVYGEFELTGIKEQGKVEIHTEKDKYYLNETKTIPYLMVNNTYGKITYDSSYKIEKNVGGKYVEMKLKDVDSEIKNYELNDGQTDTYSISLSNIDEKLVPGQYRLGKKINGQYVYKYFELSNDNIAKMTTDKEYYFSKDDSITLTITNETNQEISYGRSFRVEKFDYKKGWSEVSLKDISFTQDVIILKPYEEDTQVININNIDEDEMYGDYRIVKEFNGYEVYADFSYGYAVDSN